MCNGYFPPFDRADQMMFKIWKDDRDAAEAIQRDQWRAGQ